MKQNFYVLLCLTGGLLFSCKKQHSCQCVVTIEKPGYYPYTTTSTQPISKKTSTKNAEKTCSYSEKQLHKYVDGEASPDETVTTSCAVK